MIVGAIHLSIKTVDGVGKHASISGLAEPSVCSLVV